MKGIPREAPFSSNAGCPWTRTLIGAERPPTPPLSSPLKFDRLMSTCGGLVVPFSKLYYDWGSPEVGEIAGGEPEFRRDETGGQRGSPKHHTMHGSGTGSRADRGFCRSCHELTTFRTKSDVELKDALSAPCAICVTSLSHSDRSPVTALVPARSCPSPSARKRSAPMDAPLESDEAGRWMTYGQLAAARRINRASAERLARREKWRRQKGNDGFARVLVPLTFIEPAGDKTRDNPPHEQGEAPPGTDAIAALQAAVTMLGEQLAHERTRADTAQAHLDGLRSKLADAQAELAAAMDVADRANLQVARAARPKRSCGGNYRPSRSRWARPRRTLPNSGRQRQPGGAGAAGRGYGPRGGAIKRDWTAGALSVP